MKILTGFALLAILSAPALRAQALPDKPQPALKANTETKEFWLATAVMAASWSADTVTTSQSFARNPTAHEDGGLFNGTRSTPKIMGAWAAVDVVSAVASYEIKNRVHNKYLHPLWRVPLYVRIEAHSAAAIHNSQQ